MEPTQELVDQIYREKVERARRMDPVQKVKVGAALFDAWCQMVAGAVRSSNPDATQSDVNVEIRRRLSVARRLDAWDTREHPLYQAR